MQPEYIDANLAEVIGIVIGDGCISEFKPKSQKNKRLVLLVTGNYKTDTSYYVETLQPTIQKAFGKSGRLYHRNDDNTICYWITDRKIAEWFVNIGLPVGPKIDKVKMPNRIFRDTKLAVACLRGIFNTDGCVFRRYSKRYRNHAKIYPNYAVVEFKMRSEPLLVQVKEILARFEIKANALIKDKTKASVVRITSQTDVARFMEVVHPRAYHIDRYKSIVSKERVVGPVTQPGRVLASIA